MSRLTRLITNEYGRNVFVDRWNEFLFHYAWALLFHRGETYIYFRGKDYYV